MFSEDLHHYDCRIAFNRLAHLSRFKTATQFRDAIRYTHYNGDSNVVVNGVAAGQTSCDLYIPLAIEREYVELFVETQQKIEISRCRERDLMKRIGTKVQKAMPWSMRWRNILDRYVHDRNIFGDPDV